MSKFELPGQSRGIEIIRKPANEVVSAASAKLNEALKASNKTPILLMLSGGSALNLLDEIDADYLNSNVTITVLDERYSTKPDENNFAQVVSNPFYGKAVEKRCTFIDTRVKDGETQEDLANRFNRSLVEWFEQNPEGKVIATVGVGVDGHTSGIMPYSDAVSFGDTFDKGPNGLVVPYDATGKNPIPERVTTTPALLRKISTAIVFATGNSKRDALIRLLAVEGWVYETPARLLKETNGEVCLVTDIDLAA